jgi:septum formation protein
VRILRNIILASASPRRRALLSSVGLDVCVVASRYEEHPAPELAPRALAARHARGKAMCADLDGIEAAVLADGPPIVGADTVVDLDGTSLGKPRDPAEGRSMLRSLAGREHLVHTAFCVRALDGRTIEHTESTRVRFYPLTDDEIDAYVATGDGADKAGSYGIQGIGAPLVERVEGDFYTVVGFPLAAFVRSLPQLGFSLGLPGLAAAGIA